MAHARVFTSHDDGTTAELPVGATFAVELSENPTTGHRWSEPGLDGTSVAAKSDEFEPGGGERKGGGGVRRFEFRVKSAGKTAIHLAYRRKWESGTDASRQFDLTIDGSA